MSYTKKEFILESLSEIGIASYVFDVDNEQLQTALKKLDAMMATWNFQGIRIGYPLPLNPNDSTLDDDTNVPDSADEAIILNLAIRLAPSYGKMVQAETKQIAKEAYNTLLGVALTPNQVSLGLIQTGAGSKRVKNTFVQTYTEPLDAGNDSEIIYN